MTEAPQIIAQRADTAMRQGRFDDALADLSKLVIMAPNDGTIRLMQAYTWRAKGDFEKAEEHFDLAIKLQPNDAGLHATYASWLSEISKPIKSVEIYDKAIRLAPNMVDAQIDRAIIYARHVSRAQGIKTLEKLTQENPNNLRLIINLAILQAEVNNLIRAKELAKIALGQDPDNYRAQLLNAQIAGNEQDDNAINLYTKMRQKWPDDVDVINGEMGAIARTGNPEKAISQLTDIVREKPQLYRCHNMLTDILWQHGDKENFTAELKNALQKGPQSVELWSELIVADGRALGKDKQLETIEQAIAATEELPLWQNMKATALSETGQLESADEIYKSLDAENNNTVLFPYMMHQIRSKRFEEAANIGLKMVDMGMGSSAWPYIGVAWRMMNDPRWGWLQGDHDLIKSFDLDGFNEWGDELKEELEKQHVFKQHPFLQSLRGGTQTDGKLLLQNKPIIQKLTTELDKTVRAYIDDLPAFIEGHPLLGTPRDSHWFAGSWSVRLTDSGLHVDHFHSEGVISSAFYVELPKTIGSGATKEGWLRLGQPPAETDSQLDALEYIKPVEGRLALFPSYCWHGTEPFPSGTRMTVAFDIQMG